MERQILLEPRTLSYMAVRSKPNSSSEIILHFDGACEPNPNYIISCGGIITLDNSIIHQFSKLIISDKKLTNNVSEYTALIECLIFLYPAYKDHKITCNGDSKLVINQMSGKWRIDPDKPYGLYALRAQQIAHRFSNISYQWVPNAENEKADYMSRLALRGVL